MRWTGLKIQTIPMQNCETDFMTQTNTEPPFDQDISLMFQVAEGSEHAFRMIVEKWQRPLMNYFFRSCNNTHSAEDMAQQTFLNLFRSKDSYVEYLKDDLSQKPRAKFSTYLFHIARNVLITEHRKSVRRPSDATDPLEMDFPDDKDSSLSELEEIFYSAVEKLPENQRTAILLLKQQQISYEEIADIMKANVQSVKTWIHRARTSLREALENANNPRIEK
jgi:RNA polymerase sigma factor, sigma-70 family